MLSAIVPCLHTALLKASSTKQLDLIESDHLTSLFKSFSGFLLLGGRNEESCPHLTSTSTGSLQLPPSSSPAPGSLPCQLRPQSSHCPPSLPNKSPAQNPPLTTPSAKNMLSPISLSTHLPALHSNHESFHTQPVTCLWATGVSEKWSFCQLALSVPRCAILTSPHDCH